MAKEPSAGRVKTRLGRDIGQASAAAIYRAMQATLIARLSNDPRWQTVICIAPDSALSSPVFPLEVPRAAQGSGDLGARMQRVFDDFGRGPLVIIGTDIPAIKPADVAAAFSALKNHDAVIGPASDGGYWLIGMKRFPRTPHAFANVRWSGAHARADTLANLKSKKVALLREIDDLDTAADLPRLKHFVGRRVAPLV